MAVDVSRVMAEETAGTPEESAEGPTDQSPGSKDPLNLAGHPSLPPRPCHCDVGAWQARYPPGYGAASLPDYNGRVSPYLFCTSDATTRSKPGDVRWFFVGAYPGSRDRKGKRLVQVLIPQGQDRYLIAARPELDIPGAAMIT